MQRKQKSDFFRETTMIGVFLKKFKNSRKKQIVFIAACAIL